MNSGFRNVIEVLTDFDPPLGKHNTIEERSLRLIEQKIGELESELQVMLLVREALRRHTR